MRTGKLNLLFIRLNDPFFEAIFKKFDDSDLYDHKYVVAREGNFRKLKTGNGGDYTFISQELFEARFDAEQSARPGYVLDSAILESFRSVENTFLSMSDRLSYTPIAVRKRKVIYYTLLSYWLDFFDKHKVDLIFFQSLPHMGWDYILFEVARYKKISTVYIERTLVNYFVFLIKDGKPLKSHAPVNHQLLAERLGQESVVIGISKTRHPDTFFRDLTKILYGNIKALFRSTLRIPPVSAYYYNGAQSKLRNFRNHIEFTFYVHKLERLYRSICTAANLEAKYVYFPLHLQPERTTCPMGGDYDFQLLALEVLSRSIPADFEIVVKEHPRQFDKRKHILKSKHARDIAFYHRLATMPKVRVVDYNESHGKLLKHSHFTATITGSVGWEGLLLGKAAVLFGQLSWYAGCKSCYSITTAASCKAAVDEILTSTEKMVSDNLHAFLRENQDYFVESLNSYEAVKRSGLDFNAAVDNVVKSIHGDTER